MKLNRKPFFQGVRELFGSLNQKQVEGLEFLLAKFESDPLWLNLQQIAYVLATVDLESAHTFQPIKEFRARVGTPGRKNQDRYWLSGYYGRGLIQITWKKNYEKFGIADDPDKALEPEIAYNILAEGMLGGLFTGRALGEFINERKTDYVNARKVVNGLDKAEQIAKVASKFEAILRTAETAEPVETESAPPETGGPVDKSTSEVETVQSNPPVIEVKTPSGSIGSKIAAATAAIGPALGAAGIKIGGIELSAGGVYALAAIVIIGMIVGAVLWDRDRGRQLERQKLSVQNLASHDKANVIAAGSKA